MRTKFTVIYTEPRMTGSHCHTLTQMRRVEQREGETVADVLKREGIACAVFLFHGHPPLRGEEVTTNV